MTQPSYQVEIILYITPDAANVESASMKTWNLKNQFCKKRFRETYDEKQKQPTQQTRNLSK